MPSFLSTVFNFYEVSVTATHKTLGTESALCYKAYRSQLRLFKGAVRLCIKDDLLSVAEKNK